jgi:pyruvate kinase
MARIAEVTERSMPYADWLRRIPHFDEPSVPDALARVACETASELETKAIFASTVSGSTARRIASHRPVMPIIAPTPEPATYRQLALVWGVEPLLVDEFANTDAMIVTVVEAARALDLVQNGDLVIITAGVPLGGTGLTNTLKVHYVGEELGWR